MVTVLLYWYIGGHLGCVLFGNVLTPPYWGYLDDSGIRGWVLRNCYSWSHFLRWPRLVECRHFTEWGLLRNTGKTKKETWEWKHQPLMGQLQPGLPCVQWVPLGISGPALLSGHCEYPLQYSHDAFWGLLVVTASPVLTWLVQSGHGHVADQQASLGGRLKFNS